MNKFNIIILLSTISVLSLFNGDVLVVNANPNKPGCDLVGSSTNVMTRTTIMSATPIDATNLITFSASQYSQGDEKITVTLANLQAGGAIIHTSAGTLSSANNAQSAPTGYTAKTGCTDKMFYKQGGVGATLTLYLTVPTDITSVNSITISVLTASGYDAVTRQAKSVSKSGTTTTTSAAGPTPAPSPTPAPTTTAMPSTNDDAANSITFDSKYSTKYSISSDKKTVTFTATLTGGSSWVAIGVSPDGKMSNSGKGSDIIICSDGVVKRYWVKSYDPPSEGKAVTGATCTQSSSETVMKFTRNAAASGDTEHPLLMDGETQLIWAYSSNGNTKSLANHLQNKGAKKVNLKTGTAGSASVDVAFTMFLHGIFMALAWAILLPSGVLVAHYERNKDGNFMGAKWWFGYHRTIQYVGWFVQLLGFIFIVVYVSSVDGIHFGGLHTYIGLTVTILATLQPLNAYFRPHGPKPGEVITSTRQNWQYLHKGSGYTAAILGFLNVIIGVLFGWSKFQNGAFTGITGALLGIGFLVLTGYWISKCMSRKVSDEENGDPKKLAI